MKLSDKIIKLRKAKGWSQEDFAEKLNVSRQAVSRWENGTALPDANNILQLSRLFQVSADYLLNEEYCGEGAAASTVTEASKAADEAQPQKKRNPMRHLVAAAAFAIAGVIWLCVAIDQRNMVHVILALGNAALACIQWYLYAKAGRKR